MLKILAIIFVSFIIIYVVVNLFNLKPRVVEGLTNEASSGEAGSASSYAAAIKSLTVKLQDELLISKYRKNYEEAIINLDDYVGYLMIKQTLNIKQTGDIETNIKQLNMLNALKNAKDSLNATMTFLDKQ